MLKYTPIVDKFAISASAICAVHCLTLPILVGVFPALSTTLLGEEAFHVLLLWMVIPLSLFSLSLGCKRHKSPFVILFGACGLVILTFTALLGHDLLGETGERIATLAGAAAIASAHVRNYLLCRQSACTT